jgi:hypothetical protein
MEALPYRVVFMERDMKEILRAKTPCYNVSANLMARANKVPTSGRRIVNRSATLELVHQPWTPLNERQLR